MIALLLLLLLLNFGISWWNAYATGKGWYEAKHAGGWRQFISVMGAIMTAVGFTWCYLVVIGFIAGVAGVLNAKQLLVMFQLGYLILIPSLLFSAYAITIDSWARAYREGGAANWGVAAWNTFATGYDTYHAITGFEAAFDNVKEFFSSDGDGDEHAALVVVLLVLCTLALGIVTTVCLIKKYAASEELPQRVNRAA